MVNIIKGVAVIVATIILGFIVTGALLMSYEALTGNFPVGTEGLIIIWVFSSILVSGPIRGLINRGGKMRGRGGWESPEQIRDRVISTPQFVGRLDRKRGLLETTARMVELDMVNRPNYWTQQNEYRLVRFRGEILDQNGSPLEAVPVEVSAKLNDWVGSLAEGDRVRVEGKFQDDGILHSDKVFNFSTNSLVGSRK